MELKYKYLHSLDKNNHMSHIKGRKQDFTISTYKIIN